MATNRAITDLESLDRYCAEHHFTRQFTSDRRVFKPYQWRWTEMEPAVIAAAELVRLAETGQDRGGEVRRSTIVVNPRNSPGARLPVFFGVQCVLPGEQAISHRHSPGATRFVIKGSPKAYTVVDGEPYPLEDGDFITTPPLIFHGHVNESDDYVLWLDALDGRFTSFGANWHEDLPSAIETVQHERIGHVLDILNGHLRRQSSRKIVHPAGAQVRHVGAEYPPPFRYTWKQTAVAFAAMKLNEEEEDPYDCYTLTYSHPLTGGPTFPTTANEITMLTPGFHGREHRHNSNVIYHGFRGRGVISADGERFEWSQGDFVEIPAWTPHRHENPSGEDAFLYSFSDWPAQQALGQYFFEER
jgi:gentisate 1,2-dioxygenase